MNQTKQHGRAPKRGPPPQLTLQPGIWARRTRCRYPLSKLSTYCSAPWGGALKFSSHAAHLEAEDLGAASDAHAHHAAGDLPHLPLRQHAADAAEVLQRHKTQLSQQAAVQHRHSRMPAAR